MKEKEEIATLIGKLKYLQTDYIKQLDIIEKYIGQEYYCFDNESVEFEIAKNILNKLKELKEGK